MKLLIIFLFLLVLINLGAALIFMMRDRGQNKRMAKALSWRIGLSVAIFVLLFLAYASGLIQPHGVVG